MKLSFIRTEKLANYLVATVLVVVPFHAFLTVWASTLFGHYALLRLWDEVLLAVLVGVVVYWLAKDATIRKWCISSLLVRLICAYAALTLLLGVVSLAKGDVTLKALSYGLLVNLRFLIWFLAVLITAQRSPYLRSIWPKLLLVPAAIVTLFAVLQFTALPHDFLGHFGYKKGSTIAPTETINNNAHYLRVQSTLRGANPLGAYLVVVLAALGVLILRSKQKVAGSWLGLFAVFALYASGSRSAWIGVVSSLLVIGCLRLKARRTRLIFGAAAGSFILVGAAIFLMLRHNTALQNAVLHTQDHSTVSTSSNAAHASAVKSGVEDVLRQPLGDGPGTAGPASEYNAGHPVRIAENYYVQIAQETGWLGLALFVAIVGLVAVELYANSGRSRLALVVLASLVGISIINLLSHAWTDDTLAFLWWGLAAIALARPGQVKRAL